MPIYRITAPNGIAYQIEGPPGASDAEVADAVMAQYPESGRPAKQAPFSLADTGLSALQGLSGAAQGVASAFGADNAAAKELGNITKYYGSLMTPERQAEQRRRALLESQAASSGDRGAEVSAFLGGVKEAPIQAIAQGVGSAIPAAVAGATALIAGAPVAIAGAVAIGVRALVGAVQGAGEVKSSIYETVERELIADGMSPAEARKKAIAAQEYIGKNAGTIAGGAGLGAVAGSTGAEAGLSRAAAKAMGAKLAKETAKEAAESGTKRFLKATGKEAITEGAQGGQGQYAENVALTREGIDTPAMRGVLGSAARDAAVGALTGAAVSPLGRPAPAEASGAMPPPPPPPSTAPEAPPGTQGELFTPEQLAGVERGRAAGITPTEVPPQSARPAEVEPTGEQLGLGLEGTREYADLVKERERLKRMPQTPEVKARIDDLTEQLKGRNLYEIDQIRARQEEDAAARKEFPGLAETAPIVPRGQTDLFTEEEAPVPDRAQAPTQEPIAEPTLREKGPKQLTLPLRRTPEGQPTTFGQPEPTITAEEIMLTAIPLQPGPAAWVMKNVAGTTRSQLADLVKRQPDLIQGPGSRARLLRTLLATDVPAFKEAPRVLTPNRPKPATQPVVEPGVSEPSVGVPSEPAAGPSANPPRATRPPRKPATPVSGGLATPGQPAGQGVEPQRPQPGALTEPDTEEADRRAEAERMRVAMEAAAKPSRPAPQTTAEPRRTAPPARELPERLREPIGASDFGMEEGEVDITRGPQGMLFPMTKAEEAAYGRKKQAERDAEITAEEETTPAPEKDERQGELDLREREEAPTPPKEEPKRIRTALSMVKDIDGKNLIDVAEWAVTNMPDADQRIIAQRIADTLRELQKVGVKVGNLTVRPAASPIPGTFSNGARGLANLRQVMSMTAPSEITIEVNHPDTDAAGKYNGVKPEVILHELVHAATMSSLRVGNKRSAANTALGKHVSAMYDLANAIFKHVDDKHARGETLNATEKLLRTKYMRDVDEVLAWGMTNRDMQDYMETVPYKGTNMWDKFVTLIRDILGLTAKADTALSELLRIGGALTGLKAAELGEATKASGKQFSLAPSTEALVDAMGPLDGQQKSGLTNLINGFKQQSAEPSLGTKFRTQAADIAATIESRISNQFNGAVRDSLGKLNPMGLYRQAQDYTKMLLSYLQRGGFVKDQTTGLWVVSDVSGVRPPAEIYKMIDDWGKRNGYSREKATQYASRVLEAMRLDQLLKADPDFPSHMDAQTRAALVAEYNADPAFKAMNKLMDEARIAMVDNLVAVGRLSPEKGKDWKDVVGYVPFDRIDDFAEKFSKAKRTTGRSPLMLTKDPELRGSLSRPVGNVFDNYMNTLGWMVGQTVNNDARIQTLRTLEDLGQAKFLHRSPQGKANTASAYVDGELNYWELPSKYDVLAFKDLNAPKAAWLQNLGAFSNVLRTTVTSMPPFALKQLTDDIQRAIVTSGVKSPGALLYMSLTNFPKLAFAALRGIKHPVEKELGAMGIAGAYDFVQGKPAASLMAELGYKPRGFVKELLHRLNEFTQASDLAVRKAIYDQTIKESGDQLLAQTRAREFINFRRRGASDFVGAMVTTIPFFNAYVQGMDVLYRAASGADSSSSVGRAEARKLFWNRAAVVTALSAMYALGKDEDDEDYAEADLRTRDSNWFIGGQKLSVPGELGAIFKVIPERVVEYYKRQGTPEEQEAFEAMRTGLTFIFEQYVGRVTPIPQAVKPLLEAFTNHSFLTGRELEGTHHKQMLASQRRSAGTSELAIQLAEFAKNNVGVEVSPIMLDNAMRGYFGSTAALVTATTDSLLNPSRVDRPLHKWALLSNYMIDPVGTRRITEFYEERERVGKLQTTLNDLAKTDMAAAEKFVSEHEQALALNPYINSTLEQLEKTRAYRKYLNSADGAQEMSKEDRARELEEVRKYEVELTKWLREAKTEIRKQYPK